jgi:hypothetical protein
MDKNIGIIAITLLDVLNHLKIYHWQTTSYARHKASCELIKNMDALIDQIIEMLQGSKNTRLRLFNDTNKIVLENQGDDSIVKMLEQFKNYLSNIFPQYFTNGDTDILNLRDELLGNINKTLYLFTFH